MGALDFLDKKNRLESQIESTNAKLSEVKKKIGAMTIIPRHSSEYSESSLHNWKADMETLESKLLDLWQEMRDLVDSDDYKQKRQAKVARLANARDICRDELVKCKEKQSDLERAALELALKNEDILKTLRERIDLDDRVELLSQAIGVYNLALSRLK